jgi:CBS-domain-containing membrane protein
MKAEMGSEASAEAGMRNSDVNDVMTRDVVSIREFTPYKAVVRILMEHGVSALPVVDERYHVLGVVSEADLIEKEAERVEGYPESWELLTRRGRGAHSKARAELAGELMTSPAITVRVGTTVAQAARLMRKHGVKRLPVVDGNGVLVGIVSRSDLLKPFLRSDEAIRDAVVRDVLRAEMCVDPQSIDVRVRDGVVILAGEMENEFVARDTARLVRELDGVVSVVDRLRLRVAHDAGPRTARGPVAS